MSARRAPARTGEDPLRHLAILAATVAAALVAALFGWSLWLPDPPGWWTSFAVVLGAVVASTLIAAALVWQPRPRDASPRAPHQQQVEPDDWPTEVGTVAGAPFSPPAGRAGSVGGTPVGASAGASGGASRGSSGGDWWNRGAPAPAARELVRTAPVRAAPRDLARLGEAPRVVQCPRCGAFRVDVRSGDPRPGDAANGPVGHMFRCRVDGHEWTWQPGSAWPATVVASRRRRSR